ncbi:hypothetical protein A2U01_0064932, partial [Trifolium medium]|nr:hypothetical protein [Trifolium medium]
ARTTRIVTNLSRRLPGSLLRCRLGGGGAMRTPPPRHLFTPLGLLKSSPPAISFNSPGTEARI